ncbi:MAG: hypothetical protein PHF97_07905 [Bacteroidales bacterium]|nr:hypothetical protein [Bacteroidales bacterium]
MNEKENIGQTQWEKIERQFELERSASLDVDLKNEILNKINMNAYHQSEKKPEIIVVRSLWKRPVVKFGFVFLLGVFTGLFLFSFFQPNLKSEKNAVSEMKGTLYDSRTFDNMKTADVLQFENPLVKSICNVRYSSKLVEIRIDLSSLYPVKSTLEFDYNNFEVLNIQNVTVNDQSTALAAANFVQINNVGDNKFIIQLYNKNSLPHQISFKIYQNDNPIYQNSVQVNKE